MDVNEEYARKTRTAHAVAPPPPDVGVQQRTTNPRTVAERVSDPGPQLQGVVKTRSMENRSGAETSAPRAYCTAPA